MGEDGGSVTAGEQGGGSVTAGEQGSRVRWDWHWRRSRVRRHLEWNMSAESALEPARPVGSEVVADNRGGGSGGCCRYGCDKC